MARLRVVMGERAGSYLLGMGAMAAQEILVGEPRLGLARTRWDGPATLVLRMAEASTEHQASMEWWEWAQVHSSSGRSLPMATRTLTAMRVRRAHVVKERVAVEARRLQRRRRVQEAVAVVAVVVEARSVELA